MVRNSHRISILFIVLNCFFFCISLNAEITSEERSAVQDKKILIIHSYHQDLAWTRGQDEGIREVFDRYENIDITTEYLDSKRFEIGNISKIFGRFLAQKYKAAEFDAVMATDNNALDFLSRYHKTLFGQTPVVFSGINNYNSDIITGFEGIATGVVQVLDPTGTFILIEELQPELEKLFVVSGTTPTAQAIRDEVKTKLSKLQAAPEIEWLDGLATNQLLGRLKNLSIKDAVLLCNFNRDSEGKYYSHAQSGRMISKASGAPVYAMEDHYLGTGVTGGYMNSSRDQGIVAGTLCVEILKTGKIPEVVTDSPNAVMFDYKAMERFGLNASILPASAVIINKPVSFYAKHKMLIWDTIIIFCLLLGGFLAASIGFIRARRAEGQYRRSEENLRITLNSIGDAVIAADTTGCITEINPVAEKLTGWKSTEAKGRPLNEMFHIVNAQTRVPAVDPVRQVLESGKVLELANNLLIAKNGVEYQISNSAAPIRNNEGLITGVVLVFRDVTKQYHMQEQIRKNQERLRVLFENTADAIYVCDPKGRLVQVNHQACLATGYSREELLSLNVTDIDDKTPTPEALQEFLETVLPGRPVTFDTVHFRKDGSAFPVEIIISRLETSEGTHFLGFARDITERKDSEDALKQSRARYQTLFDSAGDCIFVMDGLTITDCNQKSLDLFRCSRKDIIGHSPVDLSPPFQPDGKNSYEKALEITNSVQDGQPLVLEWKHKKLDGTLFDAEVSLNHIELTTGHRILTIVRDITERIQAEKALKESEAHLRSVFRAAPTGIGVIIKRVFKQVNEQLCIITGYSEDELLNRNSRFLYLSDENYEYVGTKKYRIINNHDTGTVETQWKRKDGCIIDVLLSSAPIDTDDLSKGVTFTVLDITERKRTEKALQETEARFRNTFNQTYQFSVIVALDGTVIEANNLCYSETGLPEKQVIGCPFEDLLWWRDDQKTRKENIQDIQTALNGNIAHRETFYINYKKGERLVDRTISPVYDEHGEIIFLLVQGLDIAERKQSEIALNESKRILSDVLNTIPVRVFWKDLNSVYLGCNQLFAEDAGKNSPAEVIGNTDYDMAWAEQAELYRKDDKKIIDTKEPTINYEEPQTTPEGKKIWLNTSKVPLRDSNGNIYGLLGTYEDITYRKQNRQVLSARVRLNELAGSHSSRQLMRAFLDEVEGLTNSKIGFFNLIEEDQKTLSFQEWSTKTLNTCEAKGSAPHFPVEKAGVWADCIHEKKAIIHNDYENLPNKKGLPKGHAPIIRELVVPVFREGKIVAILGVGNKIIDYTQNDLRIVQDLADMAWDIIERKRAEEALRESENKYRTIFEESADATLIIEGNKFIDCNEATVKMLGYDTKQELLQTHPSELSPPFQPDGRHSFEKANEMMSIAFERGSHRFQWAHKRRNGQVFPVEVLLTAVSQEDRNFLHVVWRDITERNRFEQERENLLKALEFKNRELQDIVYTASHDLRSPLVNIEGFSGVLREDCENLLEMITGDTLDQEQIQQIKPTIKDDIPESLGFITGSARKMASLLDGLLQISRIGTVKICLEKLDVNKIAGEILKTMEYQINKKNITVQLDELPMCTGDTHMLDHLFTNLISNAIKYCDPSKESMIRISGKVEGHMTVYCVEDNGIGIAKDYQKKIFEIFHRLDPDDSTGGEGLGLTIVKRVLDRMGGNITVESEPGTGSKFFINLPAWDVQ